jgi:hypothetical protein
MLDSVKDGECFVTNHFITDSFCTLDIIRAAKKSANFTSAATSTTVDQSTGSLVHFAFKTSTE